MLLTKFCFDSDTMKTLFVLCFVVYFNKLLRTGECSENRYV